MARTRASKRLPVTFDAGTHEYRVAGHVAVSVTTCLRVAGELGDTQWFTDEARDRGKCVHEACMNIDLGVDHGCKHPEHHGYIYSYKLWKTYIDHAWDRIEEPAYSDAYGVAGTADRVGIVKGRPAICDLKTSGVKKWHPLQFALYDLIYDDLPPRVRERIGIYLREDGRVAQMLRFNDPSDHDRALHAVRKATA